MGRRLPLVAVLTAILLAGCGGSSTPEQGGSTTSKQGGSTTSEPSTSTSGSKSSGQGEQARGPQLFAPDSIWNAPLAQNAPLDPSSPKLVAGLTDEVRREQQKSSGPYIETTYGSVPLYTVPRDQPVTTVRLRTQAPYVRTMQRAFDRVPIPADARAAPGPDRHLTIWQPSTDRLWEFWRAKKQGGQWTASYGGAIRRVSHSPGYFTARSWPGARPVWGASASSLPLAGGLMTVRELERGQIDHALAIALPAPRKDVFSLPAQRTDGTDSNPDAIPEGARLRLDPSVDVDKLDASPVVKAMARAAQRYGLIVRDRTGEAIAFYAEDPHQYGNNPYERIFEGKEPTVLLAKFPWDQLTVDKLQLRHNP